MDGKAADTGASLKSIAWLLLSSGGAEARAANPVG